MFSCNFNFFLSLTASEPKVGADTEDNNTVDTIVSADATIATSAQNVVVGSVSVESAEATEIAVDAPSAPVFEDEDVKQCDLKAQVQYPDLKSMQKQEERTQSGLRLRSKDRILMKPFNERQLKELYHNPELVLADEFEAEFISTELNCTYKDHALFELLKRYSQCRYNLKINMLDLHSFKRMFEENSEQVWKVEKRELKYSGTCGDGERIFKTEVYE